MHRLQFQTRVRKDVSEEAEEPINYFLSTDNINLAVLNIFILTFRKNILLFALFLFLSLHLMKHCKAKSVAFIASFVQQLLQTPLIDFIVCCDCKLLEI